MQAYYPSSHQIHKKPWFTVSVRKLIKLKYLFFIYLENSFFEIQHARAVRKAVVFLENTDHSPLQIISIFPHYTLCTLCVNVLKVMHVNEFSKLCLECMLNPILIVCSPSMNEFFLCLYLPSSHHLYSVTILIKKQKADV